jgi:serine/threonine-protein kinase HipA
LSIAGEAVNPTKRHVLALAEEFSVNDADAIIEEVAAAVAAWPTYAKNAGLSDRRANEIQSHQIPYAAFNG